MSSRSSVVSSGRRSSYRMPLFVLSLVFVLLPFIPFNLIVNADYNNCVVSGNLPIFKFNDDTTNTVPIMCDVLFGGFESGFLYNNMNSSYSIGGVYHLDEMSELNQLYVYLDNALNVGFFGYYPTLAAIQHGTFQGTTYTTIGPVVNSDYLRWFTRSVIHTRAEEVLEIAVLRWYARTVNREQSIGVDGPNDLMFSRKTNFTSYYLNAAGFVENSNWFQMNILGDFGDSPNDYLVRALISSSWSEAYLSSYLALSAAYPLCMTSYHSMDVMNSM